LKNPKLQLFNSSMQDSQSSSMKRSDQVKMRLILRKKITITYFHLGLIKIIKLSLTATLIWWCYQVKLDSQTSFRSTATSKSS